MGCLRALVISSDVTPNPSSSYLCQLTIPPLSPLSLALYRHLLTRYVPSATPVVVDKAAITHKATGVVLAGGAQYWFEVTAENGAGSVTKATSVRVTIDDTPPVISHLELGNVDGEETLVNVIDNTFDTSQNEGVLLVPPPPTFPSSYAHICDSPCVMSGSACGDNLSLLLLLLLTPWMLQLLLLTPRMLLLLLLLQASRPGGPPPTPNRA